MSLPRIIAICGRRRSGKDTVADVLVHEFGYRKLRISDPLKAAMAALFGWDPGMLEDHRKDGVDPRWGISPRQAMQFFGTEVMQQHLRALLPDMGRCFFVQRLLAEMDAAPPHTHWVIPDLRFSHEEAALRARGAEIWKVCRAPTATVPVSPTDEHVSEREWMRIQMDRVVLNHEDMGRLAQQVRRMMPPLPLTPGSCGTEPLPASHGDPSSVPPSASRA